METQEELFLDTNRKLGWERKAGIKSPPEVCGNASDLSGIHKCLVLFLVTEWSEGVECGHQILQFWQYVSLKKVQAHRE